ncbi:MAG: metallophosphoesterase [Chloroflexi bacterium]|nr:metallophosphoesterase [Chloroflexota bacterium]
MVNVAAVGDLHIQETSEGMIKPALTRVNKEADLLILAGDLTHHGRLEEAAVLLKELADIDIPIVGVLGNHDFHDGNESELSMLLSGYGIHMLDGGAIELEINGVTIGLTGSKGFGGGFGVRMIPDFGETTLRKMYQEAMFEASKIGEGLDSLETDFKVVVLHYAPIRETLQGEPLEIYPFLGTSLLAEQIDHRGADLVVHGHAHHGFEAATTAGGVPVRNVAMPILGRPYIIYRLGVSARTQEAPPPLQ